jgi:hypothetical protein
MKRGVLLARNTAGQYSQLPAMAQRLSIETCRTYAVIWGLQAARKAGTNPQCELRFAFELFFAELEPAVEPADQQGRCGRGELDDCWTWWVIRYIDIEHRLQAGHPITRDSLGEVIVPDCWVTLGRNGARHRSSATHHLVGQHEDGRMKVWEARACPVAGTIIRGSKSSQSK